MWHNFNLVAGDRVQVTSQSNPPRGTVLQHFDRGSRFVLVRWDGGVDTPIEKSRVRKLEPTNGRGK